MREAEGVVVHEPQGRRNKPGYASALDLSPEP